MSDPTTTGDINLANLDVVFVIDRSGSMGMESDTPTGQDRWTYTEEGLRAFAREIGAYDDDGIDIFLFNTQVESVSNVQPDAIDDVFKNYKPASGTVMAPALQAALNECLPRCGEKQQLIIVVTDGQPSDRDAVASTIIEATKKISSDRQLAFLFVQVGKDQGAHDFLVALDDDLEKNGAAFDIVDHKDCDHVFGTPLQTVVNDAFND